MKRITFLATKGCLSSSFSQLIDSFEIANRWQQNLTGSAEPLFEFKVISQKGESIVCSDCIRIEPHFSFADKPDSDYFIIPAFLPVPETRQLQDPELLEYIRRQHAQGTTVAAVCTGSFLLAETGLLNGRIATTNWQFEKKFRYRHPSVNLRIDMVLTEQDNLMCTGAATAVMNLALQIMEREGSSRLASACAKALLVDPNRESQAPYTIYPVSVRHPDDLIRKAEAFMLEHMAESITIDEVADFVCLSPRHFKRRFKNATGDSPLCYLQKLRIQAAKDQLENSGNSIEDITRRIGYEDSSTFRRLFKRHSSLSPREYRDKFLRVKDV